MRENKQSITIRLAPDIMEWIEVARGRLSKTEFITRILVARMERDREGGSFRGMVGGVGSVMRDGTERIKCRG